jgi:RNA polymerase sigma factor (sigma-70 family)
MAGDPVKVHADPETLPRPRSALSSRGRALLEENIHLIRQRLDRLSRRSGLPEDEAEEFRSWALFKLVNNDYRILASWKGRSSLSTFLTVVLVNLMRDYRIHVWGKWRPSAAALRQGSEAVLLERLWVRDGLPLDEVIERMRKEHAVSLSRSELERLAASLRQSPKRRRVSEEELLRIPTDGQMASRSEDSERARTEERLCELLVPLLRSLQAEDRLLLKLHYWDGLTMAEISRLQRRPQRKLYTARDRCLRKLRRHLEESGVSPLPPGPRSRSRRTGGLPAGSDRLDGQERAHLARALPEGSRT